MKGMDKIAKRLLKVALVGSPNVGKSTLLNKLVNSEISCVSNKVHTTRTNVIGVYTEHQTQLEFYDSPGIVSREHLLKHRLEDSLYTEPTEAAHQCDMIVVVVDASNVREKRRLNLGLVKLLNQHQDKKSILVMNKVDLVKEKRDLLSTSTRLSQGCLEDRLRLNRKDIERMSVRELAELNLLSHATSKHPDVSRDGAVIKRPLHKYVIELEKPEDKKSRPQKSANPRDENFDPDLISYKKFSHIFSISALRDEGVLKLRDYLLSQASIVAKWPHGPSYLSNQTARDIVHSVIRGRVMDEAKYAAPYTICFRYHRCDFDEMGSLHVNLSLRCPEKYMVPMIIGDRGVNIARIIDGARKSISRTLGSEVKLDIQVMHAPDETRHLSFDRSKVPDYLTRESSCEPLQPDMETVDENMQSLQQSQ